MSELEPNSQDINDLSSSLTSGDNVVGTDITVDSSVLDLADRLIGLADEDIKDITPEDRAVLNDLLSYDNPAEVALRHHLSADDVRQIVFRALRLFAMQVKSLHALYKYVEELEATVKSQKKSLSKETRERRKLKRENNQFRYEARHHLSGQSSEKSSNESGFERLDERSARVLKLSLADVPFPPDVIDKLAIHDIRQVYELVVHTGSELTQLEGIGRGEMSKIRHHLRHVGFRLGSEIRWVEAQQAFYIKKR